ncbi:hypothetical protein OKW21_005170 [Catalinimonas alkaloidigena]|nr:hypothetical protein [Catalinimonas alkaloidigena]
MINYMRICEQCIHITLNIFSLKYNYIYFVKFAYLPELHLWQAIP